jgi:hypothetical protein
MLAEPKKRDYRTRAGVVMTRIREPLAWPQRVAVARIACLRVFCLDHSAPFFATLLAGCVPCPGIAPGYEARA